MLVILVIAVCHFLTVALLFMLIISDENSPFLHLQVCVVVFLQTYMLYIFITCHNYGINVVFKIQVVKMFGI